MKTLLAILFLFMTSQAFTQDFKQDQQRYPRVRQARADTEQIRDSLFRSAGVEYPPARIFIRAFKHERVLELWAADSLDAKFELISSYPFTAFCGDLGPKRKEGDIQIPEGFYHINLFNPASSYHLSMQINYPNLSDRIRATNKDHPGGLIFIHGNRVTIGCIPIGDRSIEELYVICVDAKTGGQDKIPVHIFPCRFDSKENLTLISVYAKSDPDLMSFWEELIPGYEFFQNTNLLPEIKIDDKGRYLLQSSID